MKRLTGILLLLVLLICGCSNASTADKNGTDENTTPTQDSQDSNQEYYGYACLINDVWVIPGQDFAPMLEKLGEPNEYYEAASCYFDGMDKQYLYDGFEVKTYPVGDKDYVQDVCISEDILSTVEGITVGSTLEEVLNTYGDGYELVGKMYKYFYSDVNYVYFFVMNDAVKYFGYAIDASN